MKILHVLAQMPSKTGSGVYYSNVIRRFCQQGHRQRAVYAFQDSDDFDLLPLSDCHPVPFKSSELPFPIAGMSDAMPYESTKYSQMDEAQINTWSAAFSSRLQHAKEQFQPDVVLLHHLWILTSLGADIFSDTVTVGICHNTDLRQAKLNPVLKKRHVTSIGKLSAIFSLSDDQKPVIAEMYQYDPAKIITVGGAYDETVFYAPPQKPRFDGTIKLVYAAKIAPSKGIYSLLKAYGTAKQVQPALQLDIIGTPNSENRQRFHNAVEGLPDIRLFDAMSQKVLADHLRQRDVFVMPSFYEGIALMALECLA